jgi:hypothetical protein
VILFSGAAMPIVAVTSVLNLDASVAFLTPVLVCELEVNVARGGRNHGLADCHQGSVDGKRSDQGTTVASAIRHPRDVGAWERSRPSRDPRSGRESCPVPMFCLLHLASPGLADVVCQHRAQPTLGSFDIRCTTPPSDFETTPRLLRQN